MEIVEVDILIFIEAFCLIITLIERSLFSLMAEKLEYAKGIGGLCVQSPIKKNYRRFTRPIKKKIK